MFLVTAPIRGSTRHLRTLKASHLRTLQTSHLRTEKPRHPRTKSGHPRTLRLGTSHFGFGCGGWGGWGGMITFMFLCTHRHSNLIIFLPVEQRQAQLSWSVTGGVGWVNKVHVPMPAHAQQPHHLSCCRALTRTALSWSVTRGVGGWGGWGGMITFMFLCTHRHSNLIIFLAVGKRQAQLFHDQLPVGWGELLRFMFVCLHTHSNLIIFLAVEHLHALLFHVWDELCELWDEFCERTWVNFSERTRKQLHQMAHKSSSWVSWVV